MLETRKIRKDTVLVTSNVKDILIRKSGRAEFNKEKQLVSIDGDSIRINSAVAAEFGLEIKVQ